MRSKTITFDYFFKLRIFEVEFISKSKTANILMNITMEGFPIDTIELEYTHPLLYRSIRKQMNIEAESNWEQLPDLQNQN